MTTSPMDTRAYDWTAGETRSPLDWLSRWGIGLLSHFAKLTDKVRDAKKRHKEEKSGPYGDPTPEPMDDDKCCHLALPNTECSYSGSKANYTCPPGYYRQWWFCCEGTQQIGCGECTGDSSTCWSGPFVCSIWWWTGQSC